MAKSKPKSKAGRKPSPLAKRYQIRCSPAELQAWEARAKALGFASASAWIQRLANAELGSPIPTP